VQNRFRNWIAARRSDPVPTLLTIAGCVMSAAALLYALTSDWLGVVANIIADLILIGPALLISNIIVRRIQDARVRARVQPLLHVIAQLLHWAVPTAKQALDTLEIKADLDMPGPGEEQIRLAHVERALADAIAQLHAHHGPPPTMLAISKPLSFPRFSAIRRLVQQADQAYPMPWSIAAANLAEDWAERCGVDFMYRHDGQLLRRRYVGLAQVEEHSKGAVATAQVDAESYLQAVEGCLHSSHAIARRLAEEAPPGLPHEALADPRDVGMKARH
jgi:hypothetical protein